MNKTGNNPYLAPQPPAEAQGWYCAHCRRGVDAREVTYSEQHEVCGRYIANDDPPPSAPVGVEERAKAIAAEFCPRGDYDHGDVIEAIEYALAQQPAAEVYVDFPQVGTAGPLAVVDGKVTLPDTTMNDLIRHARTGYVEQPAAAGEEIMVNAAHDVYTLPLHPSGLSSGPRFVVHVPAPDLNAWRAAYVAERAMRYRDGGMKIEQARIHAETDAARIAVLTATNPSWIQEHS